MLFCSANNRGCQHNLVRACHAANRKMLISLKRLDGTDYLENATARIRLRQRASGVLSVAVKEGKAEIDALPCEPIIVDFGL